MAQFTEENWSELLGLPYIQHNWYNYYFNKKFGNRNGSVRDHTEKYGTFVSLYRNANKNVHVLLKNIINHKWKECCNLYSGLITFCFKFAKDKITYFPHSERKDAVSLKQCCENLHFPDWAKKYLDTIFKNKYSFEDYLHGFDHIDKINFDIDTALRIVELQGEKAIFSILMQLFYTSKFTYVNTAHLLPELPIIWRPKASHLANSTGFPVVATRFSDKFEWKRINNGFFLFDEFNNVIDCIGIGRFNLFKESLGTRLSFLSHSGELPNYLICWSYDDLFNALQYYHDDLLIRNLSGGFNGWYKFGPNAQLVCYVRDNFVYGKNNKKALQGKVIFPRGPSHKTLSVCNLRGELLNVPIPEEPIWNNIELDNWFLIGDICDERLEMYN